MLTGYRLLFFFLERNCRLRKDRDNARIPCKNMSVFIFYRGI